jgi:hypothetical protein
MRTLELTDDDAIALNAALMLRAENCRARMEEARRLQQQDIAERWEARVAVAQKIMRKLNIQDAYVA